MGEAVNTGLVRVDPRFPGAWEALRGYLESALQRGGGEKDWGLQDVYQQAVDGIVQLFAGVTDGKVFGAIVTCESSYPQRRVIEVLLAGTDPHTEDQWASCFEQLKSTAKASGIAAIVGTGRPGWGRKLGASRTRLVWEVDL